MTIVRATHVASIALAVHFCIAGIANAQQFAWAGQLVGNGRSSSQNMFPGESRCTDMVVDAADNVYIVGWSNDTIDFDLGASDHTLTGRHNDLFLAKYDANGALLWADLLVGPTPQYNDMVSVDLDPQGNVVVLGRSTGALDMDPGPGLSELTPNGTPNQVFIAKYETSGALLWAKNIGGPFGVMPYDMDVAANGDILITGNFYQQLDADPSANVDLLTSSNYGLFFAKYNANGDHQWAKAITEIGIYGGARCIRAAPDGTIALGGFFSGTVDLDPDAGTQVLTTNSFCAAFIAKYTADGGFMWTKGLAVLQGAYGRTVELEVDVDGSVVVLGDYVGIGLDMDPGPGVVTLPGNVLQNSAYFGRFDATGNLLWGKGIHMFAAPCELALDEERNIFISGSFSGADFDPGPSVALLVAPAQSAFCDVWAKYDLNGNYCWARTIGNNGYGGSTVPPAFAVKSDRQYLAGAFKQTADLDPGPGVASFTSSSNGANGYIAQFNDPSVSIDLGVDRTLCAGTELVLDPGVDGVALLWQNGTISPTQALDRTGLYWVRSVDDVCAVADSVFITVEDCSIVLTMPNVFTPNGDAQNDRFVPVDMNGVTAARLDIYNRWGQKIHSTTDLLTGWKGTIEGGPAPDGVYFWSLVWSLRDGSGARTMNGNVTLIR